MVIKSIDRPKAWRVWWSAMAFLVSHKTPEITLAFPIKNMTKRPENVMNLEPPTLGLRHTIYIYIMTYKKGSFSTMTWGFNVGYVLYIYIYSHGLLNLGLPKEPGEVTRSGIFTTVFNWCRNFAGPSTEVSDNGIPAQNGGLVRWEHHRTTWEKEPFERHVWGPEGTSYKVVPPQL